MLAFVEYSGHVQQDEQNNTPTKTGSRYVLISGDLVLESHRSRSGLGLGYLEMNPKLTLKGLKLQSLTGVVSGIAEKVQEQKYVRQMIRTHHVQTDFFCHERHLC